MNEYTGHKKRTFSVTNVARNLSKSPEAEEKGKEGQYSTCQFHSLSNIHQKARFSLWTTKPKLQKGVFTKSKINISPAVRGDHSTKQELLGAAFVPLVQDVAEEQLWLVLVGPRSSINYPEEDLMVTGP